MLNNKTIIALSSPPGHSGIAVIRLSGSLCRDVLKTELSCSEPKLRQLTYKEFVDPESRQVLDKLTYVYMEGPKTYTGEDTLEIYCHGNPIIIRSIMDTVLANHDVRIADKGEFTRRALENRKIDLVQAEAVGELIHATNKESIRNAHKLLGGELSNRLDVLRQELLHLTSLFELDVDFAEEELEPDYVEWKKRIAAIRNKISTLLDTWERGKRFKKEIRVGLFGAPNAGKSSLINAILKTDRVLVSEKPGTTRDYVEVAINLPDGLIHLVDTAGIGSAIDEIDERAMDKSKDILSQCQYTIHLLDGSPNNSQNHTNQTADFDIHPDLVVVTKQDLPGFANPKKLFAISNKTGLGVTELVEKLNSDIFHSAKDKNEDLYIATERQYHCLKTSLQYLDNCLGIIESKPEVELLAFELREAWKSINELIGDYYPEETLIRIFSHFCIGK